MSTILHAVIGYFFLALMVRVLIRRPGSQMTMAEFVLVFLMGGVIILSTVGTDRSETNCTCAVITIALLHRFVSWIKLKYPLLGMWIDGTPVILVRNGQWQYGMLQGMNLAEEDVMAAARGSGVRAFESIDYAVLERNGGITILKKEDDEQSGEQNDDSPQLDLRAGTGQEDA